MVDLLGCSVLAAGSDFFVDREMITAAIIGKALARPGTERRHEIVLCTILHRPEAESEETLEYEEEAAELKYIRSHW
jgi:hypothetical protein